MFNHRKLSLICRSQDFYVFSATITKDNDTAANSEKIVRKWLVNAKCVATFLYYSFYLLHFFPSWSWNGIHFTSIRNDGSFFPSFFLAFLLLTNRICFFTYILLVFPKNIQITYVWSRGWIYYITQFSWHSLENLFPRIILPKVDWISALLCYKILEKYKSF